MAQPTSLAPYDVVWPRSEQRRRHQPLARRLDTLNGKTIVQLWDYLFYGDEVFATIEDELKKRFPGVRFVNWAKIGNTHGTNEQELLASFPRRFKELGVDAAISAMGC